ncbi:MAG: hypothetical protein GEV13_24585 [Rhodospirillales bacterium]|nr:hypothetical protein [Rhodospirillales bacterium]
MTTERSADLAAFEDDRIEQWILNHEKNHATKEPLYLALLEDRARRDREKGRLDVNKSLDMLIQAAKEQRYVTYGDLATANNVDWKVARHQMNGRNGHLDRLVDVCHARGLPQLSAICVNKSGRKTGELEPPALKGFVAAARRIGLQVHDEVAFHHQERDECFRWGRDGKK